MALSLEIKQSLTEIDESAWNQLGEADYPFIRHEFLLALEQNHCLLEFGWQPVYFVILQESEIVAAIASYIKSNSYGELVFDHSWAQAYEQSGHRYYPKLVSAIPYTPANGPRFLIHRKISDIRHKKNLTSELIKAIQQFCISHHLSSWHCLFEREKTFLEMTDRQLPLRYDCQYHWSNQNYTSFEDFLASLSSRKRKNIKKERASVQTQDLNIQQLHGDQLSARQWSRVHQLYAGIFDRKYGTATLTESFFQSVGQQLNKQVMVVLVMKNDNIIAASLFFVSDSTLYGRVWGCDEYYSHLHFECCYYQGIDYCINNGLSSFDPGAQGEHKISRGFLPVKTCSAHWFPDENFQQMIKQYLVQEEHYINDFCAEQRQKSPYKKL